MGKLIDETGNVYFYWTVTGRAPNVQTTAMWYCVCRCGNTGIVSGAALRNGKSKSCGCYQKEMMQEKYIDLTGRRFGRLVVLELAGSKRGRHLWKCLCDCGTIVYVTTDRLTALKGTRSCGCLHREIASKNQTKDLLGKWFSKLYVESKVGINKNHQMEWLCRCVCGNHKIVTSVDLIHGKVNSCGCNKSNGEQIIQSWLEKNSINFEKEKRYKDCRNEKPLPFDFFLPDYNMCIEYDGIQHYKEVEHFSKKTSFEERQKRDKQKTQYCIDHGITLLRIPYWDEDNIDTILSNYLLNSAEEANSSSVDLSA